jgi:hypothetical protein
LSRDVEVIVKSIGDIDPFSCDSLSGLGAIAGIHSLKFDKDCQDAITGADVAKCCTAKKPSRAPSQSPMALPPIAPAPIEQGKMMMMMMGMMGMMS